MPFMPLDQPYDVPHGLQGLPRLVGMHWVRPIMRVQPQLIEREQACVHHGQLGWGDGRRGPLPITEAACDPPMAPRSCRRVPERHPHGLKAGIVRQAATSAVASLLQGSLCGMIELMGRIPSTLFFSLLHAEMVPRHAPL